MSTTTMPTTDEIVSSADLTRFLVQILEEAGQDGLTGDELTAAIDRFIEMNIDAGAIALWQAARIRFAWRSGDLYYELQADQ